MLLGYNEPSAKERLYESFNGDMNTENINLFQTDRMIARQIQTTDFDDIFKLHNDPLVARTLGGTKTESEVKQCLVNYINQWQKHGYCYWIFFDKKTSEFIGRGGLRHVSINNRDEVEIGFSVKSKFWGKGFATEIGKTAIEVARSFSNINNLVCFTTPDNKASLAVMKKLGFVYEHDFEYVGITHVLYRLKITRD